ncbi:MAG: class I SAM-dependent methyltransferase [Actinomycetota bacterium]
MAVTKGSSLRLSLQDRLVALIREAGPVSFATFMEMALYDPEGGFYANPPVGEQGHFVTAPHVSPAFGDLLARQLAESWEALGTPRPFDVVEVGAGDGTLAIQVLAAVRAVPDLAAALRYTAVERTPGALAALRESGLEARASLAEAGPVTGCVLANEVLDNLPFHRLRERGGQTIEVFVGLKDDRLVEVEGEPTVDAIDLLDRPLGPGEERPVSPAASAMVRDLAAVLERGYSFFFDYGFGGQVAPGPVHAYREHRVLREVLDEPGSRDVTAAVDLEAVGAAGRRAGLQVWGPVGQREALLGLGFRLWASGVRRRQAEAEARGDWRKANRLYGARSRASILVDPVKLGGLQLLAFGTEGLPPPAAVLGDRDTGC